MVERRIHTVYVTRNTEYHLRKQVCVAVRDRRSGQWLHGHKALTSKLSGALKFTPRGSIDPNPGTPREGECLYFCESGRDLVTSAIIAVQRPAREVVSSYP
jgi:hypothetical protein